MLLQAILSNASVDVENSKKSSSYCTVYTDCINCLLCKKNCIQVSLKLICTGNSLCSSPKTFFQNQAAVSTKNNGNRVSKILSNPAFCVAAAFSAISDFSHQITLDMVGLT